MAESTSVALAATTIPSSADIARAEKFVRERFLFDGEDAAVALAAGTPRRRALDGVLAELSEDPKAKQPSTGWRREFSLLLGLERLMSDEEPKLADGTVLSAHQVDALSGTLTALLAESQRSAPNGRAAASASPELLASADILGPDEPPPPAEQAPSPAAEEDEEEPEEDEDELDDEDDEDDEDLGPVSRAAPDEDDEDEDEDEDDEIAADDDAEAEVEEAAAESDEEPRDWVDEDDDEETLGEQPEDPERRQALLVRARHGRGQDGRGARLRRGVADRRRADPHPPAQPRRPVPRRAARPRLLQAHQQTAAPGRGPRQRSGHRGDLPVVRPQRGQDLQRLHDRDLRRGAHRAGREDLAPRSASGPARSSSA